MAKKDYPAIASSVVELVGGKDNISSVKHCITRLRFMLKDQDKAKTDDIKAVSGVVDVVIGNGQYQVVIGPDVEDAFDEVIKLLGAGFDGGAVAAESEDEGKKAASLNALPTWFRASSCLAWAAWRVSVCCALCWSSLPTLVS